MKRFILFCVAACLLACEDYEPEYLFDASPEERLDQIINDYSEVLTAPENGWIGFYTSVNNIGGFAVLLKFEKDGNVTIKNEAVGFANIAEKHSWVTNTSNPNVAPMNVRINCKELSDVITKSESYCEVYDLTIEGEHEYFANGVLVHNCIDATRYYVLGELLGRIMKPKDISGVFGH